MNNHAADDAINEVVGFIMILALVAIVLLVWIVIAVPADGAEREAGNTIKVVEQFSELKYGMDMLWQANESGYVNVSRGLLVSLYPGMTDNPVLPLVTPHPGSGTLQFAQSETIIQIYRGDINIPVYNNSGRNGLVEYRSTYNYAEDVIVKYDSGGVYIIGERYSTALLPPAIGNSNSGYRLVIPVFEYGSDWGVSGTSPASLNYQLVGYEMAENSGVDSVYNIFIESTSSDNKNITMLLWDKLLNESMGFIRQNDASNPVAHYRTDGSKVVSVYEAKYKITGRAVAWQV